MTFSLVWLPEVLERAGLKVAEVPGWRTRGRAEMGAVRGVICHHTATNRSGNMPTLQMLIDGRPDLAGPLCQLGLGRDGTFYVVAAGRANHAGLGSWEQVTTGNSSFIGIEAENSGRADDSWPDVQMDAYRRGTAALLAKIRAPASMCCGHKEYAPKRKVDPSFDMALFRAAVAEFMAGKTPAPLIAAVDTKSRPTLRRGARSPQVEEMQRLIGIDPDGVFGPKTESMLREKQRALNLVPDGICGPKTWAVLRGETPPPAPPASSTASPAPPAPSSRPLQSFKVGMKGTKLIQRFEQCEAKRPDGSFSAYPDPGSEDGTP